MLGPMGLAEQQMCGDEIAKRSCLVSGVADRKIIIDIGEAWLKSADELRRPIVAAAISVALARVVVWMKVNSHLDLMTFAIITVCG